MNDEKSSALSKDSEYMLFLGPDEKLIYETKGLLENTVYGRIVLTDKKLFFYFVSNISRDKVFIATHPFLKSAELKSGLGNATLVISNKNETFTIKKINKKQAKELYEILYDIIQKNK